MNAPSVTEPTSAIVTVVVPDTDPTPKLNEPPPKLELLFDALFEGDNPIEPPVAVTVCTATGPELPPPLETTS